MSERLWEKYVVTDSGCWEFTGARDKKGYGYIGESLPSKKQHTAHRAAYMLAIGPIPEGLVVRHKCDNPPGINPDHLELGTQADNMELFLRELAQVYGVSLSYVWQLTQGNYRKEKTR